MILPAPPSEIREHMQNNIAGRLEKTVKKAAVVEKINTEFFWNGKNTVSVHTGNKFAGHMKGTNFMEPQQEQPYMAPP